MPEVTTLYSSFGTEWGIRTLIKLFLFHMHPNSSSISQMHLLLICQFQPKTNLFQLPALEWRGSYVCVMVEAGEPTWTDEMLFPEHFSIYHSQNSVASMNQ